MKILKNAGTFVVLSKTEDVIHSIALAARTCYQSQEFASDENDEKLVKNLMKREHYAMIEFADMTVRFDNCSRCLTHELVRHRLCSFAQESTRYVDESDFEVVLPPHRDENDIINLVFEGKDKDENGNLDDILPFGVTVAEWLALNEKAYRMLRLEGWKPEDARQILPAIKAQIVIKCNLREWLQIFKMRCDLAAHWEIRTVMLELLRWCQVNIPIIFDNFHFFKTKDGIEYARPVISDFRLGEELRHYCKAYGSKVFQDFIQAKVLAILQEKMNDSVPN
jgi:thymidylate synthase (FAD)